MQMNTKVPGGKHNTHRPRCWGEHGIRGVHLGGLQPPLSMLQGDPAALPEVRGPLPELQLRAGPPLPRRPGAAPTADSAFA